MSIVDAILGKVLALAEGDRRYLKVIRPSGDTTGVTDIAAINAALATYTNVVLHGGDFYTNAPIQQGSTTSPSTLVLWDAAVHLVAGSNCNIWRTTTWNSATDTAVDVTVRGVGRAWFDGQASSQVRQNIAKTDGSGGTSLYPNIGFFVVNVSGFKLEDVTIGPTNAYGICLFGVQKGRISRIRLNQDGTTTNQDGIDVGLNCNDITVDGVTGKTGDDGFVLMPVQHWKASSPDPVPPVYQIGSLLPRNVSDIVFRNINANVGINLLRILTDSGSTIKRVTMENAISTNSGGGIHFGPQSYLASGTYFPPAANIEDITIRNIVLAGSSDSGNCMVAFDVGAARVRVSNVEYGPAAWAAIVGSVLTGFTAPTVADVVVDGVRAYTSQATGVGDIVKFRAGSVVSDLTVRNVAVTAANSITNNGSPVTGLYLKGIKVGTIYGTAFRSADTGTIDDVTIVARSSAPNSYSAAVPAVLGARMPALTSGDTAPLPVEGSRIRTDGTIDPNGGTDTTGGEWWGNGTTWVKSSSRTSGWPVDGLVPPLTSGVYYSVMGTGAGGGAFSQADMRGGLLICGKSTTLTEIGIEVTAAGSAGALVRLGIYRITPGPDATTAALVVDAGTVDASATGYKPITISQKVNAGDKLLLMGVVQGSPATNPQLRYTTGVVPFFGSATALTATSALMVGSELTGVSGALAATHTINPTATVPRVIVKAA